MIFIVNDDDEDKDKADTGKRCVFDDNLKIFFSNLIIMQSLDPLRAKKTFIRKKLCHTAVSAIKASSVTL